MEKKTQVEIPRVNRWAFAQWKLHYNNEIKQHLIWVSAYRLSPKFFEVGNNTCRLNKTMSLLCLYYSAENRVSMPNRNSTLTALRGRLAASHFAYGVFVTAAPTIQF